MRAEAQPAAAAAAAPQPRRLSPQWWPLLAGLAAMYVPTLYSLLTGVWMSEEQGHGPIILGLACWLLWRQWPAMLAAPRRPSALGWLFMLVGMLLYVVGRSQQILSAEIGSFLWLAFGLGLYQWGWGALKVQWFPFFFMLFMVPLPGGLVAALTMPMKMAVSYVTEHLLYAANYPIARSGVILQIGQYQLLVADACAGLQTLLTLESLGLLYLNVVRHASSLRNIVLAVMIIPISFTANVIRVITLTLITYYFGDAAGQGFLHGFAGMVLFVTALGLIIGIDSLLQWIVRLRAHRTASEGQSA